MKRILLILVLVLALAGVSYGASATAPQTVQATVVASLSVTVTPSVVDFGNYSNVAECRENASTQVAVSSNTNWSLKVQTDMAHSDGRLRNGAGNLFGSSLKLKGGGIAILTAVSDADLWVQSNQPATNTTPTVTAVTYQLCSSGSEPATADPYTIPLTWTATSN
jgi:hypothetical protein